MNPARVVAARSIRSVMENSGLRTIENLHHFRCKECNKWWTIGDAPECKINWFCPWCGGENRFEGCHMNGDKSAVNM